MQLELFMLQPESTFTKLCYNGMAEIAGVDIAGVDNDGVNRRGRHIYRVGQKSGPYLKVHKSYV